MKKNFFFVFLLFLPFLSGAQNLVAVQGERGKWGFVSAPGKFEIPASFDDVKMEFDNGLACVSSGGKYFFIDEKGKQVSKKYVWVDVFDDAGLCKVNVGGKYDGDGGVNGGSYGFVGRDGNEVISPVYEYIGPFNTFGLALVNNGGKVDESGVPMGGKFGYIDRTGKIIVPIEFDFIGEYGSDGLCWVNKGGKLFVSDKDVSAKMQAFSQREKNPMKLAAKRDELENAVTGGKRDAFGHKAVGGMYGMYSSEGDLVIPVKYNRIGVYSENMCRVEGKKGKGYVNIRGEETVPCIYCEVADKFCEGMAWVSSEVKKVQKFGYVDVNGKLVLPCEYKSASDFKDGVAVISKFPVLGKKKVVTETIKYGVIDKTGANLTELKYDMIQNRSEVLVCRYNGRYCLVSKSGKEITPSVIKEVGHFSDNVARVRIGSADAFASPRGGKLQSASSTEKDKGVWVLINTEGIVLSKPYKEMSVCSEGCYSVCSEKWGAINSNGDEIVPVKYDKVLRFSDGYAAVMDNTEKWGFVDTKGKEVVPCSFNDATADVKEGVGAVCKDGLWGGANIQENKVVIPFKMEEAKDVLAIASTIYVENGHSVVSDRELDIFSARKRGYKSRFSISSVIGNEYWDF